MKKTIFTIIAIIPILIVLYLAFAESHYNGFTVEIISPTDNTIVYNPLIPVIGIVSDPAAKVTVDDTPAVVAENGYFDTGVDLTKGKNVINVTAEVEGTGKVNKTIFVIYRAKSM